MVKFTRIAPHDAGNMREIPWESRGPFAGSNGRVAALSCGEKAESCATNENCQKAGFAETDQRHGSGIRQAHSPSPRFSRPPPCPWVRTRALEGIAPLQRSENSGMETD